ISRATDRPILCGTVSFVYKFFYNTTATKLGLGTGGWDVVHWNLERDEWSEAGPGHEMKLRYTSLQIDTGSSTPPEMTREEGSAPVVACFLHSQVAAVAAAYKHIEPDATLGY